MTLVSPHDMDRIEQQLARCLDRLLDAEVAAGPHVAALNHRVRGYVLRGGKRVRPQLCAWAWRAAGGGDLGELPDGLLDVACAWEVFHAFLLVHDDLIDAADTRRQTPSLHRQLQSLDHDSPVFGQNLAIVAGDLLFGVAIRLLAESAVPPAQQVELIRLFGRVACTTGYGQAIDIFQSQFPPATVSEQVLLHGYEWKTAAYTFEGPLLSGAILAGTLPAERDVLARFARAIGRAYQLHNDLLDLSVPAHDGCDLVQGKRTVTLMRARAALSDDGCRAAFDRQLSELATANGHAVQLAESLRQQVLGTSALDATRRLIDDLLFDARAAATERAVSPTLSARLTGLADALDATYFAPPVAV